MVEVFSKAAVDLLGADWDAVQRINAEIGHLADARKTAVPYAGDRNVSKTAWQVELCVQCALHRIVSITRGCVGAWNSRNVISALLCARGVMESVASLWEFHTQLLTLTTSGNIAATRELITNRMFGGRTLSEGLPIYTMKNILTVMKKFDTQVPGVLRHYELLSEFCHPNYAGVYGMFSTIDHLELVGTISDEIAVNIGIFSIVMAALTTLLEVRLVIGWIEILLPSIVRLDLKFDRKPT
jgi:hypothetical protein